MGDAEFSFVRPERDAVTVAVMVMLTLSSGERETEALGGSAVRLGDRVCEGDELLSSDGELDQLGDADTDGVEDLSSDGVVDCDGVALSSFVGDGPDSDAEDGLDAEREFLDAEAESRSLDGVKRRLAEGELDFPVHDDDGDCELLGDTVMDAVGLPSVLLGEFIDGVCRMVMEMLSECENEPLRPVFVSGIVISSLYVAPVVDFVADCASLRVNV